MKKYFLAFATIVFSFSAFAQVDSLHMQLLGKKTYQYSLSDIWGYVDSTTNKEYALVGSQDGFSVVDVTVPTNPTQKLFVPGAFSLWKDIKTWGHYAYIIHDNQFSWSSHPDEGVVIVDLDSLVTPRTKTFMPEVNQFNGNIDTLRRCHNIFIDENGIMYLFGASGDNGLIDNGGALMYDLTQDPWNPVYVGSVSNFYLHDGYARDDTLYGGAINIGLLSVFDVRQKNAPLLLATKSTPNQFAHNCWLSDDGNTVFTTDEKPNAYIAAYDVSDLQNITELDRLRTLPGTDVIPHNVHVKGDFLVTSYYTAGAHIIDAKYPDLLIEAGYYDTSPQFSGDGYHGAWGAYPFLPSGNILISDMEEGLHVLNAEYKYGSRIVCHVKDSLTKTNLIGVDVEVLSRAEFKKTDVNGNVKMGYIEDGWDTIELKKFGYYPKLVPVNFISGNYDTVNVAMLPLNFSVEENGDTKLSLYPNPSSTYFDVELSSKLINTDIDVSVIDLLGKTVINIQTNYTDKLRLNHNLAAGIYVVKLKAKNFNSSVKLVVE